MLKSMKYELLKFKTDILFMGGIFLIIELAFLIGIALNNEKMYVISVTGLSFFTIGCVFFIFISGILAYGRDLKEKSGYLVFMTPVSSYRVIGAKLLMLLVESLVFLAGLAVFFPLDMTLTLRTFGNASWEDVLNEFARMFGAGSREEVLYFLTELLSMLILLFVFFYMVMTIVYFSISMSATILQNKKGRGILATGVALCLIICAIWIEEKIPRMDPVPSSPINVVVYILPQLFFFIAVSVGAYIGTAKLLEKKISL